jgi:hypothetical protein
MKKNNYIYYIDDKKFTSDQISDIPHFQISSPNEETPAYENLRTGRKIWCKKQFIRHRLIGPAIIDNGRDEFWLNDSYYENIREWIKDHPNPDLYFDAIGLNETERILWFLQN